MSLRKAINAMCRQCAYDDRDVGSAAQQIACCINTSCPLHAYRPVTASFIPSRLLEVYRIAVGELDDRARRLVRYESSGAVGAQNGNLLSLELIPKAGSEGSLQ